MTADEIQKLAVAALEAFNEALSDAESCGHPLNGPGASVRAFKSRQEAWDALATLRDVALRTASAEPSPEVNVGARGLQAIGWQFRFKFPTHTSNWKSVLELPMSEIKAGDGFKYETRYVYARTAQVDARREDGAMQKDAERYRWLRSFATPGLRPLPHDMPMGYREIRLRVDTPVYLPSTWGADVDRLIDAAMNTTKGADHAE